MTIAKLLVLGCMMCSTILANAAGSCRAASGDGTTGLIELYTSEGCDSCPPADRWLSQLDRTMANRSFVALAYHVDYWDRLGWKDRFASADFTARQHQQTERQGTGFVYTPQVAVQGRDERSWHALEGVRQKLDAVNRLAARASISLEATRKGDAADIAVDAQVKPEHRRDAAITVALVQNGLASEVKAGENAGKRLAHDHVVRTWKTGLTLRSGSLHENLRLDLPRDAGLVSIVAFIEDLRTGDILQALQLTLCDGQPEPK